MRVFAPGRVNLIGDHTDYTGGLVLPMAIGLGTTIVGRLGGDRVRLRSAQAPGEVTFPLPVGDPRSIEPAWGRYVAAVASALGATTGFTGEVRSTLPLGAGLASSASLEVAAALALGWAGPSRDLARLCQAAEQLASGVPCGVMDQLASAAGVAGHALMIDCATLDVTPVPLPDEVEVVVVDSGERRRLAGSRYAERRASCEAAEREVGPLRQATVDDLDRLADEGLRARARHVVTENQRVREMADALRRGDAPRCGELMVDSHRSLRVDFEVSTPALDALVASLLETPGVHGARLTGAGFGGCVVALARPGALTRGWQVTAVDGASVAG